MFVKQPSLMRLATHHQRFPIFRSELERKELFRDPLTISFVIVLALTDAISAAGASINSTPSSFQGPRKSFSPFSPSPVESLKNLVTKSGVGRIWPISNGS